MLVCSELGLYAFYFLFLCFAIAVQMVLITCLLLLGTKAETEEGRGSATSCAFLSVWDTEPFLKKILGALGSSL